MTSEHETDENEEPIDPAPRNPMEDFFGKGFFFTFEGKEGVILEPEWLARHYQEVRTGDFGSSKVYIQDTLPFRHRAVSFELSKKDDVSIRFWKTTSEADTDEDWMPSGEGLLRLDSGAFVITDEILAIEALAEWRDREEIENCLGPLWTVEPGAYRVNVWRRRKKAQVAVRLDYAGAADAFTSEDEAIEAELAPEPLEFEITDTLDLHGFAPTDVAAVIQTYCELAPEQGITEARIVHGKGQGVIREMTHHLLDRAPNVIRYDLAPPDRGGDGATIVIFSTEHSPNE